MTILREEDKQRSDKTLWLITHRVLFDANDAILFRLNTPKDVATISHPQLEGGENADVRQNEEQRWVPPEEADRKEIVDRSYDQCNFRVVGERLKAENERG
ncbi:hypothetical protein BLNAU_12463 [Blattamonas nauphoetae]|uniref:Uncharacterized protein n=1 Tax=Blattamonas nauphoetae TaxID=2049346 RepID=A0ABQ9XN49_9EUKA|nr:hypothetical protein BLNAU_12463 [Blattamonas nauphoetae]